MVEDAKKVVQCAFAYAAKARRDRACFMVFAGVLRSHWHHGLVFIPGELK